ncbi:NADP-dependent oxidoreductase [Nitrospirillum sp. BR 11164]|uniref:NADP-dependent oxidoreductase n=1 Tax=Nitrospirillum sp. BR 11164 TaxID=3104324 RepID=UPI002AFEAF7B|nr:NADP-dependent oxidoreductase [Nitrospirillum sp. BR 11164]MEA1652907.1 NADP-dependent oxidoreductase [Nitrospirillum sp. BR 11164]
MRAVRYHGYGGPEQLRLEKVDVPPVAPGEVLVRQEASSVNPADWKFQTGWFRDWVPLPLPFVPGADIAGIVVAGGEDAGFGPGQAVIGMNPVHCGGAWADYVVATVDSLALAPKRMPLARAAGLPLAGLTARMALFTHGGLTAGQRVLIHTAAGGVGCLAVQLAKHAGAEVIATCSAANRDFVTSLGADEVIDYRTEDFSARLRGLDLVVDSIGGDVQRRSFAVLRSGGTLVTLAPTPVPPDAAAGRDIRVRTVAVTPDGDGLRQIADLAEEGRLRLPVDRVYCLEDAARAMAHSQAGGARGKIILQIQDQQQFGPDWG